MEKDGSTKAQLKFRTNDSIVYLNILKWRIKSFTNLHDMNKMLVFLLCSTFFLSFYGQYWLDDYSKLEESFSAQDFETSLQLGDKLLGELIALDLKQDTSYTNTLYYLEMAHFYLGDFDASLRMGKDEVYWCSRSYGEEHEFYLQSCRLLGIIATYVYDYETSIVNFEEAVRLLEANKQDSSPDFIALNFQLASSYDQAGSYSLAKKSYEKAYALAKESFSLEDSIMQVWTNTLSTFYLTHGMYEEAEPFFLESLTLMESYYGKESESYVTVLNSVGEFYLYAGWYQKSANVYQDFVLLCKKIYGAKSADYATALNNLAVAYEKLENYEKAERYYLESLDIKGKVFTKESEYYALTITNLAVLYDNMGKRKEAEDLYNEAIQIYKKIHGAQSESYAVAISSLASIYSGAAKYSEAERLTKEALVIQKEIYGEKYPAYINTLNNLGQIHYEMGAYDLAEKELEDVCELRLVAQGKNHRDYAVSLNVLANVKATLQKYGEAEELLLTNLQIIEQDAGTESSAYGNGLSTLAGVYLEMGRFLESESAYQRSLEISEHVRGSRHPDHATILNNMAQLYSEIGSYEKAESLGWEAMDITREAYGENDPMLIYPGTVLANIYKEQGDYKTAETLLLKTKQLAKNYYEEDHPNYLNVQHNLGVFYYELGNYDLAEPLYLLVKDRYVDIYGENHSEHVNVLNSLGALYMARMMNAKEAASLEDFAKKAEECYHTILSIDSSTIDLGGQDFALHLNNAAELHRLIGEYDVAEKFYLNAINNLTTLFGEDYIGLGVNYNNLALLYERKGANAEAMQCYQKAIAIKEKHFDKNNLSLANSYVNLASLLGKEGRISEAQNYFEKGLKIDNENIELNFSFLSSEEKFNYLNNTKYYIDLLYSFGGEYQDKQASITALMYDTELRNKELILKSSNQLKEQVMKSKDVELIETYENWIGLKKELATLSSLPEDKRSVGIDTLKLTVEKLEKELNRKGGIQTLEETAGWKDIKKQLNEGQAAIEFIHFYWQGDTVFPVYGALVLTKESESPRFIKLCNEEQLIALLGDYGGNNFAYIQEIYGKSGNLNPLLYQLIWEPMMDQLKEINEVFYAPTGLLNKVSFSAMGTSNLAYLSDRFTLNQLSSTASMTHPNGSLKSNDIALFGGAKYSGESSSDDVWKYLPGSKIEVEQIEAQFKMNGGNVQLFAGKESTEEAFKLLEETPRTIVHVATHGFFYPDLSEFESAELAVSEEEEVSFRGGGKGYATFVKNSDPLMRSGIVFSGANDVWEKEETTGEDGVLTAFEVANMNLSGVKMVVLSACETGLGDIKGSEGVYGLQRSFKAAGVERLIMSLWQVPDKETQEFMNQFYKALLKTNDPHKAFLAAQNSMKVTLDPYYWGAFVLIE